MPPVVQAIAAHVLSGVAPSPNLRISSAANRRLFEGRGGPQRTMFRCTFGSIWRQILTVLSCFCSCMYVGALHIFIYLMLCGSLLKEWKAAPVSSYALLFIREDTCLLCVAPVGSSSRSGQTAGGAECLSSAFPPVPIASC